jgi:hypothetical protein
MACSTTKRRVMNMPDTSAVRGASSTLKDVKENLESELFKLSKGGGGRTEKARKRVNAALSNCFSSLPRDECEKLKQTLSNDVPREQRAAMRKVFGGMSSGVRPTAPGDTDAKTSNNLPSDDVAAEREGSKSLTLSSARARKNRKRREAYRRKKRVEQLSGEPKLASVASHDE